MVLVLILLSLSFLHQLWRTADRIATGIEKSNECGREPPTAGNCTSDAKPYGEGERAAL